MEKRVTSQPVGYLLSRFGLLALLIGLVLAAWNRQVIIVVLLGLVCAAAGLAWLWSRFSLSGVSCQRILTGRRVFPGETVGLKLRLANRKLLPLPWIQVEDEMPLGFAESLTPGERPGYGFLSKATALLWYSAVTWRDSLNARKRGYYRLGPVRITAGDIFGFYPRSASLSVVDHLIVYPRVFPIARLGIPSLHPLGETTAEWRLFEDPVRLIGLRDYTPRDSRRRIHWKATARHQALQVKVFEPTTSLKIAVFLAVDSFAHLTLQDKEDFELAISTAASVANHATEQGSPVGMFVNTRAADSGQPVAIPPASSAGQLMAVLEALAKVTHRASGPFIDFTQHRRRALPWGTTLIFILGRLTQPVSDMLAALKENGHRLLVLRVGAPADDEAETPIAASTVSCPEELMQTGVATG